MRKLLFIIVLFLSTSVLAVVIEEEVHLFELPGKFLFCETDKTKNEYYAAKYIFLRPSELILFKNISNQGPGVPPFFGNNKFEFYKKISENEHHIFFENDYEIDKIKGILSFGKYSNIPWQCEIIQKEDWFLPNK